MRVLVLEDDRILAEVFRDALDAAGHIVQTAFDNDSAFALLRNDDFDLLIIDLLIDGETSIPVLDFANYAQPKAEVILVTGSGLFPRGELHYSVSDVSYRFQKPVRIADLILVVDHFERTASTHAADTRRRAAL